MAKEKTYQEKFEQATMDYCISAREYFMILRLAIHRLSGKYLKTSAEVAQYDTTEPMYHLAYRLVRTIGKEA